NGNNFARAATAASASTSGRRCLVAEKSPEDNEQNDQQENADDLNYARAGFVGATSVCRCRCGINRNRSSGLLACYCGRIGKISRKLFVHLRFVFQTCRQG